MFKNYVKIAFRNLHKYKAYSLINISGLAIGITSCLLIMLFVQDELSFDSYHSNAENIYRVASSGSSRGNVINDARSPLPLGKAMKDEFPEVKEFVRFRTPNSRFMIEHEDIKFFEKGFYFTDSTAFNVFDYELVIGNPDKVLNKPHTVVITDEMAKKYFGNENPIGKVITADLTLHLTVTGIMKKPPVNSHMNFDFLVSLASLEDYRDANGNLIYGNLFTNWFWNSSYNYILLHEGTDPKSIEKKLPDLYLKYMGQGLANSSITVSPYLQKITSIHLNSNLENELLANSDISYVYVFSAIAFFVLFIACVNFMNLSTARSTKRAKEVSMRKVVGAKRNQLITQFLGESISLSLIASIVAIGLTVLLLPQFNLLTGKTIGLSDSNGMFLLFSIIGIALLVGFLAGSYPALLLSSFKPVEVIKGKLKTGSTGDILRKGLVVVQFAISVILIIGLGIVYSQMNFIKEKRLGFNKEHLVSIAQPDPDVISRFQTFRKALIANPKVLGVSASSNIPGEFFWNGFTRIFGQPTTDNIPVQTLTVGYEFADVMGMEFVAGRNFSREFTTDTLGAIVNETLVKELGYTPEEIVGKKISFNVPNGNTVIGVVKDFHFKSLREQIQPFVLWYNGYSFLWATARISGEDISRTIAFMEQEWNKVNPRHPFDYVFMDASYNQLYNSETKLSQVFGYFTFIALFIACLGLFGLASFTAEQRTKEIGIRKVLGATTQDIIYNLSKDFGKWVIIANVFAWPMAYYFMSKWISGFAYRTEISMWIFVISGVISVATAVLTISYQSIKAAFANPINSLKYE